MKAIPPPRPLLKKKKKKKKSSTTRTHTHTSQCLCSCSCSCCLPCLWAWIFSLCLLAYLTMTEFSSSLLLSLLLSILLHSPTCCSRASLFLDLSLGLEFVLGLKKELCRNVVIKGVEHLELDVVSPLTGDVADKGAIVGVVGSPFLY